MVKYEQIFWELRGIFERPEGPQKRKKEVCIGSFSPFIFFLGIFALFCSVITWHVLHFFMNDKAVE